MYITYNIKPLWAKTTTAETRRSDFTDSHQKGEWRYCQTKGSKCVTYRIGFSITINCLIRFCTNTTRLSASASAYAIIIVEGLAETVVEPASAAAEELTTTAESEELSLEGGVLVMDGVAAAARTPRANRAVSPPENSEPETACAIEEFFARWRLAAKGATGPM